MNKILGSGGPDIVYLFGSENFLIGSTNEGQEFFVSFFSRINSSNFAFNFSN